MKWCAAMMPVRRYLHQTQLGVEGTTALELGIEPDASHVAQFLAERFQALLRGDEPKVRRPGLTHADNAPHAAIQLCLAMGLGRSVTNRQWQLG